MPKYVRIKSALLDRRGLDKDVYGIDTGEVGAHAYEHKIFLNGVEGETVTRYFYLSDFVDVTEEEYDTAQVLDG